MKKGKLSIRNFLIVVIVAMISANFVSCSKDNDSKSVKEKLVGVWKSSMENSTFRYIELEPNGRLHIGMKVSESGEVSYSEFDDRVDHQARWTYNENEKIISMFSDDGYYNYNYLVNMSEDGNSWSGIKVNSSHATGVTFVRVK